MSHDDMVASIVATNWDGGANTGLALTKECHKRQLRPRKIRLGEIKDVLKENRPIIACFSMNDEDWSTFSTFFEYFPRAIFTLDVLKSSRVVEDELPRPLSGHAVVLLEYATQGQPHIIMKNSWGAEWGANGRFKVALNVLEELRFIFFDVYFRVCDLTEQDLKNHSDSLRQEHADSRTTVAPDSNVQVRSCSPSAVAAKASTTPYPKIRSTCSPDAIATVVRAAERRIIGRTPMSHDDMVASIVATNWDGGAKTWRTTRKECKKRQLRCRKIGLDDIREVLEGNRPLIACFIVSDEDWTAFKKFSKFFPGATFTLDIAKSSRVEEEVSRPLKGHAVALLGYATEGQPHIVMKNFGGDECGANRCFKVAVDVLQELTIYFFDVYFIVNDLTKQDLLNYIHYMSKKNKFGLDDDRRPTTSSDENQRVQNGSQSESHRSDPEYDNHWSQHEPEMDSRSSPQSPK